MTKFMDLLTFTLDFTSDQIDKYPRIANAGIGPESPQIAYMLRKGVNQLFTIIEELCGLAEREASGEYKLDDSVFATYLNRVRLYVEEEYLEAYAAELIDANGPHDQIFKRDTEHKEKIYQMAKENNISVENAAEPTTDKEKQYQYDSHAAAHTILQLVVDFKADPNIELKKEDYKQPFHTANIVQAILKRHATLPGEARSGRYHNSEIWGQIEKLYAQTSGYLETSKLQRSPGKLSKKDAPQNQVADKQRLGGFRDRLSKISKQNESGFYPASVALLSKAKTAVVGVGTAASSVYAKVLAR